MVEKSKPYTKQCSNCLVEQSVENFHKSFSGYRSWCKSCRKLESRSYRERNKEKLNAKDRAYYHENKERFFKRVSEYFKSYQKANRAKYNALENRRRASKLNATPPWLTKEQLEEMEYMYLVSKDAYLLTGEEYEVDHIVPLQGKDICGLHVPWNLQVLTASSNRSKNNKYSEEVVK